MKACTKCGTSDRYSDGKCKQCARDRANAYRLANPEKTKERKAKYRAENPEKVKATHCASVEKNKEKYKISKADYAIRNADRIRAYKKNWASLRDKAATNQRQSELYVLNPKRFKEANDRWVAKNKEAVRARWHNRQAKKRASGGKLSSGLSDKLIKLQRGKCACCGLPLGDDYHLDHIVPIALGGANEDWNIQLLRAICNLQKSAKHPVDFMQSRGFLI